MSATFLEDAIWLLIPLASVMILGRWKSNLSLTCCIYAVGVGAAGWGFGPRCFCVDAQNLFLGSFIFSLIFGIGMYVFFIWGAGLWKVILERSR